MVIHRLKRKLKRNGRRNRRREQLARDPRFHLHSPKIQVGSETHHCPILGGICTVCCRREATFVITFDSCILEGSNNSGFYQLQAILTHKGRSSCSGHYVGWIRRGKEWFKCDDETVTPIHEDDVWLLCPTSLEDL